MDGLQGLQLSQHSGGVDITVVALDEGDQDVGAQDVDGVLHSVGGGGSRVSSQLACRLFMLKLVHPHTDNCITCCPRQNHPHALGISHGALTAWYRNMVEPPWNGARSGSRPGQPGPSLLTIARALAARVPCAQQRDSCVSQDLEQHARALQLQNLTANDHQADFLQDNSSGRTCRIGWNTLRRWVLPSAVRHQYLHGKAASKP